MTAPVPSERGLPELWLLLRRPVAPPEVLRPVLARLGEHDPGHGGVPARLAAAGLATLRDVVTGPGDRASAPALLAADALLTHAVEAAAEEGRAALDSLLHSLEFHRFEALLPTEDEQR